MTDDTSEKENYKGQKALRECSQGLTCLILWHNFKSYFKFCYKWVYCDHEQEDQKNTEKRMMTQQGEKLIQYGKAMSYLQINFQPVWLARLYPQRSSIQGKISWKPQRNYSTVSWQMCYVIIFHTRKNNNHPVKYSSEVHWSCTYTHTRVYFYISMYFYTHTYIWM